MGAGLRGANDRGCRLVIAIHAERVTNDDRAVRWVVPAGSLAVGRVRNAPGRLGELLSDGTLSEAMVEHTAVWMWLRAGDSWTTRGATVQSALRDALVEPDHWIIDPAPGAVLARVTTDLLDGSVGDFIRSHGGTVSVRQVGLDAVAVDLGGACEHCPAAGHTLQLKLMGELRRRCPDLTEVDRDGTQLTLSLGLVRT